MGEANAEMRKAWDGPDGDIWAASADQYETRGAGHRRLLLQAAGMSGPGEVVGIDLSTARLANARVRSAAAGLELEAAPHRRVSAPLGGMTHR